MGESSSEFKCSVKVEHVAVCTNKSPRCVSCGNNLIAFGANNSVVICKTEFKDDNTSFKTVISTLNKHTGRVNCVSWMRSFDDEESPMTHYLLSGSTDTTVNVWKCDILEKNDSYNFEIVNTLKAHTASVTNVEGIIFSLNQKSNKSSEHVKTIVASTGVDLSVCIWGSTNLSDLKDLILLQKLDFQSSLVLTISLHLLPDHTPILACGLDNFKLSLHYMKKDENMFSMSLMLPGHEDWVRGTDFVTTDNGDLLLATCSQDCFIRLWRISQKNKENNDVEEFDGILKLREMEFTTVTQGSETSYVVHLEAVLSGHEGWVYSVNWNKNSETGNLRLLSASMDKSIIIWEIDVDSGIWLEKVRFGEVGGNTLGFYGAQFNASGSEVIAHSYNGALHLWEEVKTDQEVKWKTGVVVSGHFGPVLDLSWEPKYGRYFVSTSTDQTSRLFAVWKFNDKESWHEIARPQIHGYDMQCITMIDSCRFISGADEKVLRVFEAPQNFLENLEKLSGSKVEMTRQLPEGATIPALGLSNKAVFSSPKVVKETPTSRGEQYIENQFKKLMLHHPPSEEHLLQNSLWPETNKLYWHVYEIFCVASNTSGTLAASAAKSATPQHSTIVLWNTESWKEIAELNGHTLTVTQMEFSHNGKYLLSVSRDRTWILHGISGDSIDGYKVVLFAKSEKQTCHARIIWSASWTHDDNYFCTGSRDKKIMFWKINDENLNGKGDAPNAEIVSRVFVSNTSVSVTAVAFAWRCVKLFEYLLAVGKENGFIELHLFSSVPEKYNFQVLYKFSTNESHSAMVKRLSWRPGFNESGEYWIATSAADNLLKLFSIEINK